MDIFSLEDKDAFEIANTFFRVYKELDNLFKHYGFDKDKHLIMFDHEIGKRDGLCVYFKISEKLDLRTGNGSENINFYIGALLRKGCIEYQIESIDAILYKDIELNGKKVISPFISQKYTIGNDPLPTKNKICAEFEKYLKIKEIREKFGLNSKTESLNEIQKKGNKKRI